MKRILLCLMAFSAIISSCTRDHGDMYDPEFVREYYESQWKKQFGEIDPNQTWNVAQGVQANLSIKEDALADYTFNIYTSNPLYDKDAKLMATTGVTTDAEGYAETSIKFDAPNGLKYFYVMRVEECGRRAVKAIQAAGGVLNATFGDVNPQGTRGIEEGALPTMECPYTVEQVNQFIAEGYDLSQGLEYYSQWGGTQNITGYNQVALVANNTSGSIISVVTNEMNSLDVFTTQWYQEMNMNVGLYYTKDGDPYRTQPNNPYDLTMAQRQKANPITEIGTLKVVVANGGYLKYDETTNATYIDFIVAEGGTLEINNKMNLMENTRLIVMPGGKVVDNITSGYTIENQTPNSLVYVGGKMEDIYSLLQIHGTTYIAETGVYTGTEITLQEASCVLTNWGKVDINRLIGSGKQGTLNNGCLLRSEEEIQVLYLNLNGNTALECKKISTNFVTLRENSILRADYYSSGDGTAVFKYVGKQESSSLVSAKTMHSAAGNAIVEGKIYLEIDNYEQNAEGVFTNANPMYGISKVGEANFAIFPSIDTSLEKSECTGQGNVPNDYVPETPANAIKWIIACEDLGSIGDYDFNDIVFSVTYVAGDETAVVEALAAGGTIPANVYVNNELIGEIHGLFGFDDTSKMINTLEEDLEDGSIFQGMVKTIAVPTDFSISTADMGKIRIDIINGDGNVKTAIAPTQGGAPQMICVPAPWKWPVEYTSIGAAYPKFGLWGAGYNTGIDWYSTDIATGSVFNLE